MGFFSFKVVLKNFGNVFFFPQFPFSVYFIVFSSHDKGFYMSSTFKARQHTPLLLGNSPVHFVAYFGLFLHMPISPALFKSSEKFEIEIDLEKVTGRHIFSNKFNYLLCN